VDERMGKPEGSEERPKVTVRDRRRVHPDSDGTRTPSSAEPEVSVEEELGVSVEEELEKVRAESAAHLDDLQRLKAEFENYRKRVLKEQTELVERASASLVSRLLTVLDNFDLAVLSAEETKDFEKMLKGLELVYGELKEVLRQEGLEPIEAKGRPFDPNLHEAALEVGGDETGELVVAEVLRPGYAFKGRILRPAMVKVTRKSKEQ
jgi:molecular chaperone GrpE